MCFHPDHWTWWVVRPSDLVDFIAMAKMKEAISKSFLFVLQPGHVVQKLRWKIAQSSLPVGFPTILARRFLGSISKLPEVNFLHLQGLTLRVYACKILKIYLHLPPPKKNGKDRWASSKSIVFSMGYVSFWGVTWQLDATKYKEATLQHVLDDLVSQVPFTATKPCWKPRNEVEVLDLKLKTIHKHQKKAELNKCWWSQTISTRGVLGCFVLPKVLPRWGLCQGESGYVGTTIR